MKKQTLQLQYHYLKLPKMSHTEFPLFKKKKITILDFSIFFFSFLKIKRSSLHFYKKKSLKKKNYKV